MAATTRRTCLTPRMRHRLTAAEGPLAENSREARVEQLEQEQERELQAVLLTPEELAVQVPQVRLVQELQVVPLVQEGLAMRVQQEVQLEEVPEVRLEEQLAVQQDLEARRQVEPKDDNSAYFCHERPAADPEIFLSLIVFASLHVSTAYHFLPACKA